MSTPATFAALLQASGFATSPEGRQTAAAGLLDWLLVGLAALAVLVVIVLCVRYFLRPGERSEEHVKRRVLREEVESR
ncbi:MAG: hypothetical protein ABEJ46_04975 [Gemmatimonadota bacterium]